MSVLQISSQNFLYVQFTAKKSRCPAGGKAVAHLPPRALFRGVTRPLGGKGKGRIEGTECHLDFLFRVKAKSARTVRARHGGKAQIFCSRPVDSGPTESDHEAQRGSANVCSIWAASRRVWPPLTL